MKRQVIIEVIIFLFVILFAYTSTSKFLDFKLFVFQMRLAPLPLMISIAPILGWLIPIIEALLAVSLLTRQYRYPALFGSVTLMVLFELYIISMLLSGQHLPCTCGGIIAKMSWKAHLCFNAAFIFLGIFGLRQIKNIQQIQLADSNG